jgi:hypothetical protein
MTWKNSVDRRIGSAWQSRLMRHERSQNVSSGHPPMGLLAVIAALMIICR